MQTKQFFNNYHKHVVSYEYKLTTYWILSGLRVLLNLIPETGYIHPDEYFQSIEIVAGDHFDIDVYRPWEYNVSFPVRSIVFPQLTVGISYLILKIIAPCFFYMFGTSLKSPYYLLLFPRLLMCSFSFVSDYCLYKICRIWNQTYKARLIIYASSYIMMCYVSRTFSNSIELILTSLLLYYVARCMEFSKKVTLENDRLCEGYDAAKTGSERAKYYKLRASLPSHSLNDCFILATLTVIGIFNRPTFIAFAFPLIFFWLQRGLGTRNIGFLDFHVRIITFILCGIPAALLLITIDSFYFGYLTVGEIANLEISMNNFVVTPINFIKYNALTENLQQHGLHSRFLHFLLNIPLLFNVLGVVGLFLVIKIIYRALRGRWLELPRMNSITSLMMASFVIPVLLMSIFPHQEPRFIIPILLPLVFLCSSYLTNSFDRVPITQINNDKVKKVPLKKNRIGKLELIWYIVNVMFTFFYGFCHQGGVLPLTSHLAFELKVKPHLTHIHVFTSFTYPIPTGLLHLSNTRKTYLSGEKYKYKLIKDFYLYELGSMDLAPAYEKISLTVNQCEKTFKAKNILCSIYYALPMHMFNEFEEHIFKNESHKLNYSIVKAFYPHISMEKLPMLSSNPMCTNSEQFFLCIIYILRNQMKNLLRLLYRFQLLLLKIDN